MSVRSYYMLWPACTALKWRVQRRLHLLLVPRLRSARLRATLGVRLCVFKSELQAVFAVDCSSLTPRPLIALVVSLAAALARTNTGRQGPLTHTEGQGSRKAGQTHMHRLSIKRLALADEGPIPRLTGKRVRPDSGCFRCRSASGVGACCRSASTSARRVHSHWRWRRHMQMGPLLQRCSPGT